MSESDITDNAGQNPNQFNPQMNASQSYMDKLDKMNSIDYRIPQVYEQSQNIDAKVKPMSTNVDMNMIRKPDDK